ncbi:MAG: phosphate/phosphite/phosphonate ABC transporter substrate-binding protein [Myxococcota bacterium]
MGADYTYLRVHKSIVFSSFILVLMALCLFGCNKEVEEIVTISKGEKKEIVGDFARRASSELKFAVSAMLSPAATYDAYVGLLSGIAEELGYSYAFVQRPTYREINELLIKGELTLAFICSGAYASMPKDAAIDLLAIPIVEGKSVYRSLIIVRADSPYKSFKELKGTRFAFTDPLSNTGYFYPSYRLLELGEKADDFFSEAIYTGSHDRSIVAVYRQVVSAAAVDDQVYKRMVTPNSPYWERLRVIESSSDFPNPPVVSPLSTPVEIREKIKSKLLSISQSEKGKERLKAIGIDGFRSGAPEEYEGIRKMITAVYGEENKTE